MKIALLGTVGFPYGLAEVEKQKLIAMALVVQNVEVTVICNHGEFSTDRGIKRKGNFLGIDYLYTSFITYRPEGKLKRNLFKLIGSITESLYLSFHNFDYVIISSRNFLTILKYYIISKISGTKLFLIIVEDLDTLPSASTVYGKINNKLFNKFAWKMVNGSLPISEYLIKKVRKYNPNIPILKIPTLVDLENFDKIVTNKSENYFLFCGAASYFETIRFIIDSFNLLEKDTYKLYLVTNGDKNSVKKIDNEIKRSPKKDFIKRFVYLPYSELVSLYKNASALLIPLQPVNRDIARFPHKIGEYCASRNPLISTNFGEVKYYFKHKENALMAENYDIKEYANQLEYVISHPIQSRQIGENGRLLCEKQFDYKLFGKKIIDFLNE